MTGSGGGGQSDTDLCRYTQYGWSVCKLNAPLRTVRMRDINASQEQKTASAAVSYAAGSGGGSGGSDSGGGSKPQRRVPSHPHQFVRIGTVIGVSVHLTTGSVQMWVDDQPLLAPSADGDGGGGGAAQNKNRSILWTIPDITTSKEKWYPFVVFRGYNVSIAVELNWTPPRARAFRATRRHH